ncbi:Uncharacterised protein [Vibrio cholerae]|nr:Uncharacterised protein [Vibrio cholerae]
MACVFKEDVITTDPRHAGNHGAVNIVNVPFARTGKGVL